MERSFEIDEARALVPVIRAVAGELVPLRAHDVAHGSMGRRAISGL